MHQHQSLPKFVCSVSGIGSVKTSNDFSGSYTVSFNILLSFKCNQFFWRGESGEAGWRGREGGGGLYVCVCGGGGDQKSPPDLTYRISTIRFSVKPSY